MSQIANSALNVSLSSISEPITKKLHESVLDTVGCIIGGTTIKSTKVLEGVSKNWKAPGINALNLATAAHSIEMDDFHNAATVHPGVVVIPAALEVGINNGITGERFIESVLTGYETAIRVGLAGKGSFYERGFHPTSTVGVFGATASAGYAIDLDPDALTNAFGIAGSSASGLLAYKSDGSWTKRLQVGLAAEMGVRAAVLAKNGFTGPASIFDHKFGFLKAYPVEYDISPLSTDWSFTTIKDVSFKPYACCRHTHAAIDAFREALAELTLEPSRIDRIVVETHEQAVEGTARPKSQKVNPSTAVDAQFSLQFVLGVAASNNGKVLPENFTGNDLENPEVLKIAEKVEVCEVSEFTDRFPSKNGARVTIESGSVSSTRTVMTPSGDPGNPLTRAELISKFIEIVSDSIEQPVKLSDRILSLQSQPNLNFIENTLQNV